MLFHLAFYRFSVTAVASGSMHSAWRWTQHSFYMQRLVTGIAVCVILCAAPTIKHELALAKLQLEAEKE